MVADLAGDTCWQQQLVQDAATAQQGSNRLVDEAYLLLYVGLMPEQLQTIGVRLRH